MKNWLLRWVASILALLVIVWGYSLTSSGTGHAGIWADSPTAVVIAVVALGLANSVIRPIIMFFAWPINCLTFGLFSFVLNALLFLIVGNLGLGFHVTSMLHALIGSIAMGFLSGTINFVLQDRGEKRRDRDRDRED
jgi:putative membrane protein